MAVGADGRPIKHEDHSSSSAVTSSSSTAKRQSRPTRTFSSWIVNNFARLAVWYTLITVLFRCPTTQTDLTKEHPRICQPYLSTRAYVQPYVQPYYDAYAKSYVDSARPYADQLNSKVIQPASIVATANYQKYAAPQIEKAKEYGYAQWDRTILPQFQQAQQHAYKIYNSNLAPHVDKATSAAGPYYESAKDNAFDVHQKHILPAINYSKPHLQSAFSAAQSFVLQKGIPFLQHGWSNIVIFVDGTLWPLIRAVYRDNVKPQLVMIGERIAKYQESRKLQSAMDDFDAHAEQSGSSEAPAAASWTATETTTATAASTTSTISLESIEPVKVPAAAQTPTVATDETVDADLSKWQQKFGIAAEKGTEDLKERIEDLVTGLSKSGLAEGEGLANALEKTAEVELDRIRSTIKAAVRSLPDDAATADTEAAEEEVVKVIRESGQKIKIRARNVREWSDKLKKELQERTDLAADSTLQVLDGIRDLGLQEIGMRWANMEGVTYKHWAKYHELKRRFEDWRTEVKNVAKKHPSTEQADESAQQILEESMAVTESTAKELIRLKEVAKWKIRARDDTDDFEFRAMPAAAVSAASSIAAEFQAATSSFFGGSQGTVESPSSEASSSAVDAASSASSYASGVVRDADSIRSQAGSYVDDAASSVSSAVMGSTGSAESLRSKAGSIVDSASSIVVGSTGTMEALSSKASSNVADAAESVSSIILGSTGTVESIASEASSYADEALSSASSVIIGTGPGTIEGISSSLSSVASVATDAASSIVSSATVGPSDGGIVSSASDYIVKASSSASSIGSEAVKASYSKSMSSVASAVKSKASEAASSFAHEGEL